MLKPIIIKDKIQKGLLKESKYEDDKSLSPHNGDKASILQETRVFSSSPLNTQKCLQILTKILYFINKGEESLTSQECTDIFFSITKLFQSNSERLRRMVYLLIKNLPVSEKEIFIVTSSLTKDMNSANDCYRANAIRVLSKIIDFSMATHIERYLKTAIVDKNSFVSSSALLCGLNLFTNVSSDIVKKWIGEISECINNKNPMVQFHALTLLCSIKFQDQMALEKIISSYNKVSGNLSSSLANCLLIKYAAFLIYSTEIDSGINAYSSHSYKDPLGSKVGNPMYAGTGGIEQTNAKKQLIHPTTKVCFDYIKNCLKSKDVMILFECIKCIFELAVFDREPRSAVSVFNVEILGECIKICQGFLLSSKIVDKFCIIRQLNKLSHHRPQVVAILNQDIENLLIDTNKNICILAFTTLLKTGSESNIDKLLNQINNYMTGDNIFFKIQIIEEIKNLCFIYPSKCNTILNFLFNNLRDEESYQFKSNSIDAIILIISQIPNAEEEAILQLCEFIEDCEFNSLLLRVIRFLLIHIPKTKNPSKYIRYIYNRLILENPTIRVDGVYALFYIALKCSENSKDILFLLKCLLNDNDDEVRDRTNFFYYILKEKIKMLEHQIDQVEKGPSQMKQMEINEKNEEEMSFMNELLTPNDPRNIDHLLFCISNHIKDNKEDVFYYEPYKEDMVKRVSTDSTTKEGGVSTKKKSFCLEMTNHMNSLKAVDVTPDSTYLEDIEIFDEKYNFGNVKVIGKSIPLTEREAEYTVFAKKYIYENFIVLQLNIHNTLTEQILSNVSVQIHSFDQNWVIMEQTTISNLFYSTPQNLYVILKKKLPFSSNESEPETYIVHQHFQVSLHFVVKENEMDDGYADSYSINPVSIQISDLIVPKILRKGEFKHMWESLEQFNSEAVSKFSLNFENIVQAVIGLLNTLNMAACDDSDQVEVNSTSHNMILSAKFLNESVVLCKASLIMSQQYGCLLKIICRSRNKAMSEHILKSLE